MPRKLACGLLHMQMFSWVILPVTELMGSLVNRERSSPHYRCTADVKMQSVEVMNVNAAFNLF